MPSNFSALGFALSAVLAAACSVPTTSADDATGTNADEVSLADPGTKELAEAIIAQGQSGTPPVETHGVLLHTCTSKGARPRIRLEVYVFERATEERCPGAVVARVRGARVVVPARISLASGWGTYWNDDTSFELAATGFELSVNDPEDYGYSASTSTKQVQFDCTPAPEGWGPFDDGPFEQ